jgi:hypothetical protein
VTPTSPKRRRSWRWAVFFCHEFVMSLDSASFSIYPRKHEVPAEWVQVAYMVGNSLAGGLLFAGYGTATALSGTHAPPLAGVGLHPPFLQRCSHSYASFSNVFLFLCGSGFVQGRLI